MKTLVPHIDRERLAHHAALLSLYKGSKPTTGIQLWRKLCKLERLANDAATAQCNEEAYNEQPFREEKEWENFKRSIRERVALTFGQTHLHPPEGFFLNSDPRGYALKLDSDGAIPEGMHKDWGGNGILAAQID